MGQNGKPSTSEQRWETNIPDRRFLVYDKEQNILSFRNLSDNVALYSKQLQRGNGLNGAFDWCKDSGAERQGFEG